jgi:hypothetical protein
MKGRAGPGAAQASGFGAVFFAVAFFLAVF